MTVPRVSVFDDAGVEAFRKEARLDPERVRRARNALFKSFVSDERFAREYPEMAPLDLHELGFERRFDSDLDGATKLVFETSSGLLLEAVILRIATGRTTLCVSSQVGCAAVCRFCATGQMGIARNLSVAEILDQVLQAGQAVALEGRRLRNVVFMGMGEPFHNEPALIEAVDRLIDPKWFGLSPRKVLVSTVGIVDAMVRFAERFPEVGLALSLHSVRPAQRALLIPIAAKYPLPELRRALEEINVIQKRPVMLEYLLLEGINDTDEDLAALLDWTSALDVHVNLIPYNPIEGSELVGTAPARRLAFADALKVAGRKTTLRHSLGQDIEAACGQLVRHESLARARALRDRA